MSELPQHPVLAGLHPPSPQTWPILDEKHVQQKKVKDGQGVNTLHEMECWKMDRISESDEP